MAVDDIYRCTIVGQLHGQTMNNVLFYREATSAGANGQTALASALDSKYATNILPRQSDEYTYKGALVQRFSPGTPLVATLNSTNTGAGGIVGNSLPTSSAAVIKKLTTLAGRKYRGRLFLPGIPTAHEDDSELSAAAETALATAFSNFGVSATSGGFVFNLILWHKASSTYTDVSIWEVTTPLRVQRRREVGRGV